MFLLRREGEESKKWANKKIIGEKIKNKNISTKKIILSTKKIFFSSSNLSLSLENKFSVNFSLFLPNSGGKGNTREGKGGGEGKEGKRRKGRR